MLGVVGTVGMVGLVGLVRLIGWLVGWLGDNGHTRTATIAGEHDHYFNYRPKMILLAIEGIVSMDH